MPKLENFTNRVEIDGISYRKNELKYFSSGDNVTIIYSKEADVAQTNVIQQMSFDEWTDNGGIAYATIGALLEDLDNFLWEPESTNYNDKIESLLLKNNDLLNDLLKEMKINNFNLNYITENTVTDKDIRL